jgi:hypothetical protein
MQDSILGFKLGGSCGCQSDTVLFIIHSLVIDLEKFLLFSQELIERRHILLLFGSVIIDNLAFGILYFEGVFLLFNGVLYL